MEKVKSKEFFEFHQADEEVITSVDRDSNY